MNSIKKNAVVIVALLILILGSGFFVANQNNQTTKLETKQTNSSSTNQEKTTISLQVKADGNTKDYQVQNSVGKTALEVTKLAISDVKMTGEGANAFITSINGRVALNDKKEFWKLVINGKDAEVGAGSYTVKENDKISWEIDTY